MEAQISQVQCLKVGDAHYGVGQHYSGSVAKACTMLKMQIIHLSQNDNDADTIVPHTISDGKHMHTHMQKHTHMEICVSPVIH